MVVLVVVVIGNCRLVVVSSVVVPARGSAINSSFWYLMVDGSFGDCSPVVELMVKFSL